MGLCGIVPARGAEHESFSWRPVRGRMRGPEFALGLLLLTLLFLAVALWNGFPLVFYDTGGYLAEGLQGAFLVERSPVYSLFLLFTGGALQPVAGGDPAGADDRLADLRDGARRSAAACRWRGFWRHRRRL